MESMVISPEMRFRPTTTKERVITGAVFGILATIGGFWALHSDLFHIGTDHYSLGVQLLAATSGFGLGGFALGAALASEYRVPLQISRSQTT